MADWKQSSENKNAEFTVKDNVVSFVMPTESLSVTLQAYRLHTITYLYQYKGYGTYQTAYFAENEKTTEAQQPVIEGLTFRGWYTTSDFSGEPYTFGDTLKTDVTLYADWTCNVTVHFTPAKGTASTGRVQAQTDRKSICLGIKIRPIISLPIPHSDRRRSFWISRFRNMKAISSWAGMQILNAVPRPLIWKPIKSLAAWIFMQVGQRS